MKAVLLAAGKGQRLSPISDKTSKLMIIIHGKPFLEYIINDLIDVGISEICIVVGNLGNQIRDYFGNGNNFGIKIEFVVQEKPLGTADALRYAEKFVGNNSFLLYLPDTILSDGLVTYFDKMIRTNSEIHLLASNVLKKNTSDVGTMEIDKNKVIKINEKSCNASSNLAWAGIAFFKSNLIFKLINTLSLSTRGEYEITEAMNKIFDNNKEIEFQTSEKFIDLGTPKGLFEVMKFLLAQLPSTYKNIQNVSLIQPVFIGKNTTICKGCTIGPFVSIEENVKIKNNIKISNSFVLNNSNIKSLNDIEHKIISPNGIILI